MPGGRSSQQLRLSLGVRWVATAREVTVGSRGWHAHRHRLAFVEGRADVEQFDQADRSRWMFALGSAGADGNDHAYSVRSADTAAAEYFAKWQHEPRGNPWGPHKSLRLRMLRSP